MKKIAILALSLMNIPVICINEAQLGLASRYEMKRKQEQEQETIKKNLSYAKEVVDEWNKVIQTTCPVKVGGYSDVIVQGIKNSSPEAQAWSYEGLKTISNFISVFHNQATALGQKDSLSSEDLDNAIQDEELKNIMQKIESQYAMPIAEAFYAYFVNLQQKAMLNGYYEHTKPHLQFDENSEEAKQLIEEAKKAAEEERKAKQEVLQFICFHSKTIELCVKKIQDQVGTDIQQ